MAVRAKFHCTSITKTKAWRGDGFLYDYKFSAVVDDSPENKIFWKATPAGSVDLQSVKDNLFDAGQDYYLDFVEVP